MKRFDKWEREESPTPRKKGRIMTTTELDCLITKYRNKLPFHLDIGMSIDDTEPTITAITMEYYLSITHKVRWGTFFFVVTGRSADAPQKMFETSSIEDIEDAIDDVHTFGIYD